MIVDGCLNIIARTIDGNEVHVEQCLCFCNGKGACGDSVFAEVHSLFRFEVSCAGNDEERLVYANLFFYIVEEFFELSVKTGIGILHFHAILSCGLMVVGSGIVGKCEHVGHCVLTKLCFFDGLFCKEIYFVVDTGCCLELSELAVAFEFVAEGFALCLLGGDEVVEVYYFFVERLPMYVVNTFFE